MIAAELATIIPGGAKRRGEWYDALCPVPTHGDSRPSFSFRDNFERKRIDLLCRAGCQPAAIAAACGLSLRELFHDEEAPTNGQPRRAQIEATYPYQDEAGTLLYEVLRYRTPDGGKTFKQRRPDGRGGWIWNLDGVRRVLYRLPDLQGRERVWICEGEKDVDRLREIGLVATCNPMGAGNWTKEYTAQLVAAGVREVYALPDNDTAGESHVGDVARSCAGGGLVVKVIRLPGLPPRRDKHGEDVSDWLDQGHTREELLALVKCTAPWTAAGEPSPPPAGKSSPWDQARSVADFVKAVDPEVLWLFEPILAPGSLTELFSPRGLGKTQIIYAIGVKCARAGFRVLLLDRDNSKREVKRRLRAWGGGDTPTFKVMTRDEVPPLTDAAKWATFPFRDYDLIIIDSLDAATEGVGEQDSGKPSKAIAPLLDIAHRADGPAIVILGNTIKSGAHSRGSGVVEDRADICFEIRDATDLRPTGTKDWWLELPAAGVEAWAARASRRKRRDQYRLAFIASKFRIGEEPLPFALEIDLAGEQWTFRDVTSELIQAGEQNREQADQEGQAQREQAAKALRVEIERRALTTTEAVSFLMEECGLKRASARDVIRAGQDTHWEIRKEAAHGSPKRLHPCISKASAAKRTGEESQPNTRVAAEHLSADRMDTGRPNVVPPEPASEAAIPASAFAPPSQEKDPDQVSL